MATVQRLSDPRHHLDACSMTAIETRSVYA
jgi:hypothetical protein